LLQVVESSSILAVIKKKQESEVMNESNDIDRAFNPFKKKTGGQANISIGTLSPFDQVNYFTFYTHFILTQGSNIFYIYIILHCFRQSSPRVTIKENLI